MPIFKAAGKLVLYAHVPKCGGSAVSWYLSERFGQVAFNDKTHTGHDPKSLWSKTSPQHIDKVSLARLFPDGFFDAMFTIVRNPVARLVSAYHFQLEVEKSIPMRTSFSEWLEDLEEMRAENPFLHDNHVRPMTDIVPEGAHVFHMEHGLDALVPWFDTLTGTKAKPRAVPRINERGRYVTTKAEQAQPTPAELERICQIYAADFTRFGYAPDIRAPLVPRPELSADLVAERDVALREFSSPIRRIREKISGKIRI